MQWVFLALAIILEVAATTFMKFSQGFTKIIPSILMVICYFACFTCFTFAIKKMELSTAYAIWAGLGTALVAVIGIVSFHEAASPAKIISIALIILGVIGLNLTGQH